MPNQPREIGECAVAEQLPAYMKQPTVGALYRRSLRNQRRGKREVEIGERAGGHMAQSTPVETV